MQHIYGLFGFDFHLELSTRPDNYLGTIETWDQAEEVSFFPPHRFSYPDLPVCNLRQQLKQALDKTYSGKWEINPGDGAFYGPKIDITIRDALRRSFQCATIQLDFQLPERFNLRYRSSDEAVLSRPVIIHRAILGSMERFIAIITEHFGGKW
jgi:threonyl-tRNA synthetase